VALLCTLCALNTFVGELRLSSVIKNSYHLIKTCLINVITVTVAGWHRTLSQELRPFSDLLCIVNVVTICQYLLL
jgi:hypothetical protein